MEWWDLNSLLIGKSKNKKYIIQLWHVSHWDAHLLHRCTFRSQGNTVHHSYNCSCYGIPFHMCKRGRVVSTYSHPSQACIHTLLSRGDTCKSKGNVNAGSTHFSTVSNIRSFPRVKQPQHRTGHSCPSSAGVKETCSYNSKPPWHAHEWHYFIY